MKHSVFVPSACPGTISLFFNPSSPALLVKMLFHRDQTPPARLRNGLVPVEADGEGDGAVRPECPVEADPVEHSGHEPAHHGQGGVGPHNAHGGGGRST